MNNRYQELIQKYLDADLTEKERIEMENLLEDPLFRSLFDEYRSALDKVKFHPPQDIPPSLVSGIMKRVETYENSWGYQLKKVLFQRRQYAFRFRLAPALLYSGLFLLIFAFSLGYLLQADIRSGPDFYRPASTEVATKEVGPEKCPAQTSEKMVYVRFVFIDKQAKQVELAGDFNNWKPHQYRLISQQTSGIWTITVPLKKGKYKYMFIKNGKEWEPDPAADVYIQDGFGHKNSVIEI